MIRSLSLIPLFALLAISQAFISDELQSLWEAWKNQHQKSYSALEETARFGIFSHNYKKILKFNQENDTPKLALNKFADLTQDEFKFQYTNSGFHSSAHTEGQQQVIEEIDVESLPDSVDWRNKGGVTPVKNQGECGSCWAYSVTGVLEGFYFVQHGKLLSFSEQQIIDCDTMNSSVGCNGGLPTDGISYATTYGLETEEDYPYTGTQGDCKYNKSLAYDIAKGYAMVQPNSTLQLKSFLVKSPVSVVVQADQDVFQFYSSGVIKTGCGAMLDHCVLAVGYHKVGVIESFIVKNSWGTDWGESGYVEIWSNGQQNGGQGVCGILAEPMVATNVVPPTPPEF